MEHPQKARGAGPAAPFQAEGGVAARPSHWLWWVGSIPSCLGQDPFPSHHMMTILRGVPGRSNSRAAAHPTC